MFTLLSCIYLRIVHINMVTFHYETREMQTLL